MKNSIIKILSFLLIVAVQVQSFSQRKSSSDVQVSSYTKSNGTQVESHYRTAPNSTKNDNFSTRGNTNPYNGKAGHVSPDNNQKIETDYNSGNYFQPIDFNISQDETIRKADAQMKRYEMYQVLGESKDRYEEATKKAIAAIRPLPEIPEIIDVTAGENKATKYNNGYSYDDRFLIEKMLSKLGYTVIVDGHIDGLTIMAIKEFQKDAGLEIDGCAGKITCAVLISIYKRL
jgi:peptidoglycan hydrolase-like protein with peptidoglycan-binding domain